MHLLLQRRSGRISQNTGRMMMSRGSYDYLKSYEKTALMQKIQYMYGVYACLTGSSSIL